MLARSGLGRIPRKNGLLVINSNTAISPTNMAETTMIFNISRMSSSVFATKMTANSGIYQVNTISTMVAELADKSFEVITEINGGDQIT